MGLPPVKNPGYFMGLSIIHHKPSIFIQKFWIRNGIGNHVFTPQDDITGPACRPVEVQRPMGASRLESCLHDGDRRDITGILMGD